MSYTISRLHVCHDGVIYSPRDLAAKFNISLSKSIYLCVKSRDSVDGIYTAMRGSLKGMSFSFVPFESLQPC